MAWGFRRDAWGPNMAIDTAEEFFSVLEKSKLLEAEQLAEARSLIGEGDDAKTVARTLVTAELITRWQAAQLLAGRSSFFLGKYKLIDLLGRGGMGGVFLGEHVTMNRRVALKTISRQVRKDPASLERFLGEARAVAALDHPNIVQAYSIDNEGDRYYLVMEYVDGQDLQEMVEAGGPLEFAAAADYTRQAAAGLQHGHEQNMIHCDVKPANLLVNRQGVLKIVDMGLTRLAGEDEQTADRHDEKLLGSVDYLAPEQALKGPEFDHRADIYSLGCTLYFLLTGRPPFPEGLLHERLMRHQTQQPESIDKLRPGAPPDLVRICAKMMAKRPDDRFQSAAEVVRALAAWRPPALKAKPAQSLKRAEPLEPTDSGGMPLINVDDTPRWKPKKSSVGKRAAAGIAAGPSIAAGDAESPSAAGGTVTRKARLLATPRQKIVAAVVVALAFVALLAATVPFLISPAPKPRENDKPSARSNVRHSGRPKTRQEGPKRHTPGDESTGEESTGEESSADKPPSEKTPAEKPVEKPPAEKPAEQPAVEKPVGKPPAEKPPAEKPKPRPPEPKKKDPFGKLAETADLPILDDKPPSSGSLPLATLDLRPDAAVNLELLGGKSAIRGPRQFGMEADNSGEQWLVHLDSQRVGSVPAKRTPLAQISLKQQTLDFKWLENIDAGRANYLRNCGLVITVDGQSRWLPLAAPQQIEPLLLDLDRGSTRANLPSEWLPKSESLRLEIIGLEGEFPKHEFKPGKVVPPKGQIAVNFADKQLRHLALHLAFEAKARSARVDLTVTCRSGGQRPQPFRTSKAAEWLADAQLRQQQLELMLANLNPKDKRRDPLKRQLDAITAGAQQLKAMIALSQKVHAKGKVHFRVFVAVDDRRKVVLFTTPVKKKPATTNKKQPPKR